jgi:hypothetical protein
MKKIILVISILLTIASSAQSRYSVGFSDGFKSGYCQNQGIGCMSPLPPIAPIPAIGENMNNYKDGYNRGFDDGLTSQKSSNNNNNATRERFTAKSIELSTNNIYQPNYSVKQQYNEFIASLKSTAVQDFNDKNHDSALNKANKLIELQEFLEDAHYIKSFIYTIRKQYPMEAYNSGLYSKKVWSKFDGASGYDYILRKQLYDLLKKYMLAEDYKGLEKICMQSWYETDLILLFKGMSFYYQNEMIKAKRYLSKIEQELYKMIAQRLLEDLEDENIIYPNILISLDNIEKN